MKPILKQARNHRQLILTRDCKEAKGLNAHSHRIQQWKLASTTQEACSDQNFDCSVKNVKTEVITNIFMDVIPHLSPPGKPPCFLAESAIHSHPPVQQFIPKDIQNKLLFARGLVRKIHRHAFVFTTVWRHKHKIPLVYFYQSNQNKQFQQLKIRQIQCIRTTSTVKLCKTKRQYHTSPLTSDGNVTPSLLAS